MIENIHNIETFITFFIYNLAYKLVTVKCTWDLSGLAYNNK